MIIDEDVYLEHFGVKGMKWGIRNEVKPSAKGKNSKVATMTSRNAALIGLGAAYAATYLAVKTLAYRDSGRKDARKTGDKPFRQDPRLKRKMSVPALQKEVVAPINPGYGAKGTKANCRRATFAYEMRRRGNDVMATKSKYASGQTEAGLKAAIKGGETDFESRWGQKDIAPDARSFARSSPLKKSETIFKALAKNPNGSRGELAVGWTMGGGHSVAWEIVNKKPVVFDTQSGKTYNSSVSFAKFTPVVLEGAYTRLDNKPINPEFIKRWVTNVK